MSNTKYAVIVTGSSRGIGADVARRLAADGFAVVVNYAGNRDAAESVVKQIKDAGGRAVAVRGDVAEPATAAKLFDAADDAFGGAEVLVNNAGVLELSPLVDVEDASFDRLMSVNIKGVFNGMREAAKRLPDGGRIINFSTSVVGLNLPNYSIYAATKAAVETLTRIHAKELGPRGITVNAIAPGPTATDLFFEGKSDELIARIKSMVPLGRLGAPEEVASAVSFLAGPDGRWVNGQVLRVNGGMV